MSLYRETGIVLRTMRLGEADRIVTFLTAGRGKVRAVAKGVRKTKSRFGGRLEPLNHVALLLYEGRELDVITQADTVEQFRAVREDLDRLAKATSLLECADQVSVEHQPAPRLHAMLLGALRALSAADSALLAPAFFLKVLSLEGFHPILDACSGCESVSAAVDLVAFDVAQGGALCRACASRLAAVALPADGLALVRRILGGELAAALAEPPSRATAEVDKLATRALEHHLERRMRSVKVLDRA